MKNNLSIPKYTEVQKKNDHKLKKEIQMSNGKKGKLHEEIAKDVSSSRFSASVV